MPVTLLSPAAHVQKEPVLHCLVMFPDLLSLSPLLSQFLLLLRFAESRGPWMWAAISHWPAAQKKASPGQHTSGRNWTMFPSCPQLPHKVLILLIILLFPRSLSVCHHLHGCFTGTKIPRAHGGLGALQWSLKFSGFFLVQKHVPHWRARVWLNGRERTQLPNVGTWLEISAADSPAF